MTDAASEQARTGAGSGAQSYCDGDLVATMNDSSLVAAIAQGRQAAFAEAFHRYAGALHGLTYKLCGTDAAAEVTREVFSGLWSAPERFDGQRGSLRSLLLAQAHRRAVDLLRADTARQAGVSNTAAPGRHTPRAEVEALAGPDGTDAYDLLCELPEPTAQAITLAYFAGYTYCQVAARLDQPERTVKFRIRDGLNQLRNKLDDHQASPT